MLLSHMHLKDGLSITMLEKVFVLQCAVYRCLMGSVTSNVMKEALKISVPSSVLRVLGYLLVDGAMECAELYKNFSFLCPFWCSC